MAELLTLSLALLALTGLPQFWLWRSTGLFLAYWVLNAIAVVQTCVAGLSPVAL
jgi:hypothetical protein